MYQLMGIAEMLGKTLVEMREMTLKEYLLWIEYSNAKKGIQTDEDLAQSLRKRFGGSNEQTTIG